MRKVKLLAILLIILICGISQLVLATTAYELLRPNGDNTVALTSTGGSNYTEVDEQGSNADADTTYVSSTAAAPVEDIYDLPNVGTMSGTITSVKVSSRVREDTNSSTNAFFKNGLKLGGSVSYGVSRFQTTSYGWFTDTITRPGGGSWAWSDINNLLSVMQMWDAFLGTRIRCTSQYVLITYTLPSGEILRPNAHNTAGLVPVPAGANTNYQRVDEAVLDTADYVYLWGAGGWTEDLYGIGNSSGSGTITNVVLVWQHRGNAGANAGLGYTKPTVRMGGTNYDGTSHDMVHWTGNYYSEAWSTDPSDSNPWAWTDVDNLIAGIQHDGVVATNINATRQFYIIVEYSEDARRIMTVY